MDESQQDFASMVEDAYHMQYEMEDVVRWAMVADMPPSQSSTESSWDYVPPSLLPLSDVWVEGAAEHPGVYSPEAPQSSQPVVVPARRLRLRQKTGQRGAALSAGYQMCCSSCTGGLS